MTIIGGQSLCLFLTLLVVPAAREVRRARTVEPGTAARRPGRAGCRMRSSRYGPRPRNRAGTRHLTERMSHVRTPARLRRRSQNRCRWTGRTGLRRIDDQGRAAGVFRGRSVMAGSRNAPPHRLTAVGTPPRIGPGSRAAGQIAPADPLRHHHGDAAARLNGLEVHREGVVHGPAPKVDIVTGDLRVQDTDAELPERRHTP